MAEAAQPTPGQIDATGRWVLFATISASSMAFIGQAALSLALPAIQVELKASGADLLWITNAFQLLLGALILVGGALGDQFGRKRIYMIGIVIFAGASLACGLAPNTQILIGARAIQGIGGALMIPGSLAIISAYFDNKTRGQAIGTWASFTTMTSVAGPMLGGIFADLGLWRLVFFINLPLAAAALWALVNHVPESRDEEAPPSLDYVGAVLVTLGLAGIVYGITEIGRSGSAGMSNPFLVVSLVGGVMALVAFVFNEARSDHPLMSLSLFRSRTFTGANILTLLVYGALGGALFFLPLNLVQVQGYGATVAGLAQLPFSVLLIVMSPWAGGLVDRYGPRLPLVIGPIIVGVAYIVLALPGVTAGPADYWLTYFPAFMLFGFGMGIVVAPLTTSVMGSVPQHSAGVASGINNAISRASGSLALAVLGGIALISFTGALNTRVADLNIPAEAQAALEENAGDLAAVPIPESLSEEQAATVQQAVNASFIDTFRLTMFIAAGLCFLSSVLSAVMIDKRLEPEEELQEAIDEARRCHHHQALPPQPSLGKDTGASTAEQPAATGD